jgi:hypothetical protein
VEEWTEKLAVRWGLEWPVAPVGSGFLVHLKRLVLEELLEERRCSEQGSYQKSYSIG